MESCSYNKQRKDRRRLIKKYYPAHIESKKAGESGYFVKNINNNKTSFFNIAETELFNNITGCRTLSDHYESIKENDKYNLSDPLIENLFSSWIEKGFLRDEKRLIKKISKADYHNSATLVSGSVTCGRPDMLDRWFLSKIKSEEYKKLKPQIIVCDDTEKDVLKEKNEKVIKNYNNEYSGKIIYINNKDKKNLSEMIKKTGHPSLPPYIVDFALNLSEDLPGLSIKTGGNRNSLFLASAGSNLYSSDDDIENKVFSDPLTDNKYHFINEINTHPDFYPDMDKIENIINKKKKAEILSLFNEYTGKDPRAVENIKNRISWHDIPPEESLLMEKNELKIKIITTGFYGGRWFKNPFLPILHNNAEQNPYINDQEKYRDIINYGLNIVNHKKNIFDRGSYLIGGNFCFDNTEISSLCLPIGRKQDIVFAEILRACLTPGLNLNLPHVIFHSPLEKKPFTENNYTDISLHIGNYSTRIINSLSPFLINPPGEKRLKELGCRIQEFSKINYTDFFDQLKLMQLTFISDSMNHIAYLLELYEEKPSWLAEDLKKYYELLKQEALLKESLVPAELRLIGETKKALSIFKDYLFKCGEMLYWWPEIWEAARDINLEGRGLINLKE